MINYLGCCITEYLWLGINSKSISRLEFSSPSKIVKNHCRRSRVSASDPSDNLCSLQTLGPRGSSLSRDSITFSTVGNSSEFWDSGTHTGRGKKEGPLKAINQPDIFAVEPGVVNSPSGLPLEHGLRIIALLL
ncbi:hypothetical protein ASPFODRAFT_391656 [Aspergillus luchuensis CBS 106.47]|uniref:Uncharacterized protein n=1 Tax=Aspergillus luchuensis (strain CBS 106.47) TaxID=1137211 RepID=A0A1M3T3V8_ASPLC|nr:hypothetical protein ASPFODRAFT_391656 [Aspergillus luchuensis CBS 106.47]